MLTETEKIIAQSPDVNTLPTTREWKAIYLGRLFVYWLGQCISALASIINRIKDAASSIFHTNNPTVPLKTMVRSDSSSSVSSSTETTDSDSEASETDHQPFYDWTKEDWAFVIDRLQPMLDRLKKRVSKDEIPLEDKQEELSYFQSFHEKLLRVWQRLPFEQKEVEHVEKFFKDYIELTQPPPGFFGTVYNVFASTFSRHRSLSESGNSIGPSPRVEHGGIPQVVNSCYLNAVVQLINLEHLQPLTPPSEEQLNFEKQKLEFEKKMQLDHALKLLLHVKDNPYSGGDEIWFAALALRNLLFDLNLVPDLKVDPSLGYFKQHDGAVCAEALLQSNPIEIAKVFNIDGQKVPDYHQAIQSALIKLDLNESESLNFQQLVDKRFQENRPTQPEGMKGLSFNRIPLENDKYRWEQYHKGCSHKFKIKEGYTEREYIRVTRDSEGVLNLPKALCFQLGRFYNKQEICLKNSIAIVLPNDGILDLSRVFEDSFEQPVHYRITGIVMHSGSVNSGHYTTYATRDGKTWHLYNDHHVGPALSEENNDIPSVVLEDSKNEGYLLYVERI